MTFDRIEFLRRVASASRLCDDPFHPSETSVELERCADELTKLRAYKETTEAALRELSREVFEMSWSLMDSMRVLGLYREPQQADLTGDHGLVKVWCGLRPTAQPAKQGPATFEFEPDPALFPRLPGLRDMLGRLDGPRIGPG